MSGPALRRSAAQDGWLALQRAGHLDPAEITTARARMRELAEGQGRDPDALRTVLRVIESQGRTADVVTALGPMVEAGVDEVIVDTDWSSDDDEVRTFALLAAARDELTA
jgi:alkanesulfonate monooxygenase SsuD/methylene tetrahydromethanopterin reductase-like flavin-dependent oxidoreductase (luciferase family)